jgi:hypothetical protein
MVSKALRERVVTRAKGLCEYCQTAQSIVIEMEIDHIVPESAGGQTVEENLCLACVSCNAFKGATQTAVDPQTAQIVALFNPRTQSWHDHYQWSDEGTHVLGLTATGRATIEKLKINREVVVKARKRWVQAGIHPQNDVEKERSTASSSASLRTWNLITAAPAALHNRHHLHAHIHHSPGQLHNEVQWSCEAQ